MKLILIDGGPASGKNTLGEIVMNKFQELGEKTILLDLDTYIEEFNSKWIWESDQQKELDQLNARKNMARDIDKYLQDDYQVLVIGEKLLTKGDVSNFTGRLKTSPLVYLYHLSVPFKMRETRLHQRGPHSLIDLEKDQRDRDEIIDWPGYVYENINTPETDASNLVKLIQQGKGIISID